MGESFPLIWMKSKSLPFTFQQGWKGVGQPDPSLSNCIGKELGLLNHSRLRLLELIQTVPSLSMPAGHWRGVGTGFQSNQICLKLPSGVPSEPLRGPPGPSSEPKAPLRGPPAPARSAFGPGGGTGRGAGPGGGGGWGGGGGGGGGRGGGGGGGGRGPRAR